MHNYLQRLPPSASSKYRTIKNRIDGQPPRSFISLYVFHRSRLLFSLTACFQADLSHLSFLSFHLTSQKSGCRRRQLHLRPSKRLLCLPAEENHRPDRISLAQNRHNYLGAALLHLIRGDRDKCFFSPRRTDILTFGDCQLQRPADRLLVIFLLWSPGYRDDLIPVRDADHQPRGLRHRLRVLHGKCRQLHHR